MNYVIFGTFLIIVGFLGFFLWQTLFAPKENGRGRKQTEITQSEQKAAHEHTLGASSAPSSANPTEEAIADYTKWLAIFTLFLVLANIALFISGERNVDVARESANAAKDSADAATQASNATIGLERPFFHIRKVDLLRPNGENDPNPLVDFSFFNAGRTAAIVREMNFDCRLIAPSIPPTPPYDLSRTGTTRALAAATSIIGSKAPENPMAKCTFREPITEVDYVELTAGKKAIIFFGFIKYEGMLNFVYTKGFGVYYDFRRSFFVDINSDAYNYDIKTERPEGAMIHFQ